MNLLLASWELFSSTLALNKQYLPMEGNMFVCPSVGRVSYRLSLATIILGRSFCVLLLCLIFHFIGMHSSSMNHFQCVLFFNFFSCCDFDFRLPVFKILLVVGILALCDCKSKKIFLKSTKLKVERSRYC